MHLIPIKSELALEVPKLCEICNRQAFGKHYGVRFYTDFLPFFHQAQFKMLKFFRCSHVMLVKCFFVA